jgi:hypothetical protein
VTWGLEEIPDEADDSAGRDVDAKKLEEEEVVFEGFTSPLPLSSPESAVGEAETSLWAIATAELEDVVGVDTPDPGIAVALEIAPVAEVLRTTADVLVTNEETGVLAAIDVAATCGVLVEVGAVLPCAALGCASEFTEGVDDAKAVVEVELGVAAGNVARLWGKVVDARGTAVQRKPFIEVVTNPAGRDIMKIESDTSRWK